MDLQYQQKRVKTRKWLRSIDEEKDQLVFEILHELVGVSDAAIALSTGLCSKTVKKIRLGYKYGGTRYPRIDTLVKLARCAGLRLTVVPRSKAN